MSRHETSDRLEDILSLYELDKTGQVVTRYMPGVRTQSPGARATLRDRGDGTMSILMPDGVDLHLARVVFALTHGRWPDGNLLARNGDDTDVAANNLIEASTCSPAQLADINALYAARWDAIAAAELAAQQAQADAVAQGEATARDAAQRKAEVDGQSEAVAAMWSASASDEDDPVTPGLHRSKHQRARALAHVAGGGL
jgi:hypothetical protein